MLLNVRVSYKKKGRKTGIMKTSLFKYKSVSIELNDGQHVVGIALGIKKSGKTGIIANTCKLFEVPCPNWLQEYEARQREQNSQQETRVVRKVRFEALLLNKYRELLGGYKDFSRDLYFIDTGGHAFTFPQDDDRVKALATGVAENIDLRTDDWKYNVDYKNHVDYFIYTINAMRLRSCITDTAVVYGHNFEITKAGRAVWEEEMGKAKSFSDAVKKLTHISPNVIVTHVDVLEESAAMFIMKELRKIFPVELLLPSKRVCKVSPCNEDTNPKNPNCNHELDEESKKLYFKLLGRFISLVG